MFRFILLILCLCGCSSGPKEVLRIGVDTKWYPLDFGPQTAYVNGFVEDLLLEIAQYSGMEFQVVNANWDSLFDGIKEKRYDAVLSSLPPYDSNKAKYDFSSSFLDLGPVLITTKGSKWEGLEEMNGELVGVIANDPAEALVGKYPGIIIRTYIGVPELFNAVVAGEIEGAILARIPAMNFIDDLYSSKLQIVDGPMTDQGLRLVSAKGKGDRFNRYLETIKKRESFQSLLKKWSL